MAKKAVKKVDNPEPPEEKKEEKVLTPVEQAKKDGKKVTETSNRAELRQVLGVKQTVNGNIYVGIKA